LYSIRNNELKRSQSFHTLIYVIHTPLLNPEGSLLFPVKNNLKYEKMPTLIVLSSEAVHML